MNSNEANQTHGLYRQVLDNSPPTSDPDMYYHLVPIYEELRRLLVYLGLIQQADIASRQELASIKIDGRERPVPGVWGGLGQGKPPGTPMYYDPVANTLVTESPATATSALFVGTVDANNDVVCTGVRRLQLDY